MSVEPVSYCIKCDTPGFIEWVSRIRDTIAHDAYAYYDYFYFTNKHKAFGWHEGWCLSTSGRAAQSITIDTLEEFVELYKQHKFEWELNQ